MGRGKVQSLAPSLSCTATSTTGTNICAFTVIVCAKNITVTSTNDSGAGSLRTAISNACPAGTITFAPALNGRTIGLANGELVIDQNLTILGPGPTNLAISGKGLGRVFSINSGATVLLAGQTLTRSMGTGHGVLLVMPSAKRTALLMASRRIKPPG